LRFGKGFRHCNIIDGLLNPDENNLGGVRREWGVGAEIKEIIQDMRKMICDSSI